VFAIRYIFFYITKSEHQKFTFNRLPALLTAPFAQNRANHQRQTVTTKSYSAFSAFLHRFKSVTSDHES
jgi:hypothetical protein